MGFSQRRKAGQENHESWLAGDGASEREVYRGGQKQRLSIARALLRQPRIIIFDEATSALDPESEAVVVKNLAAIARGRTTIVISHRLQTIREAGQIIVLDQGQVSGIGTHDQLLAGNAVYRALWMQQMEKPS